MGSVVLAEGVAERVEKDLKGFLGRGKWYAERGAFLRGLQGYNADLQVYPIVVDTCFMDLLVRAKLRSSKHWLDRSTTTSVCSTSQRGD
jgi:hypothetical protein